MRSGGALVTDRSVFFGWVSLLQDLGSKMVVPVLPLFLVLELGADPIAVGVVDGVAAVSASVAAFVAGRRSMGAPLRWVRVGYGLSSAMKLALAAVPAWQPVVAVRVVDRAGKGIRDAPRDVLLASTPTDARGRAFGIHQAMDKTGGFLGPLVGLAVFRLSGGSFTAVFIVAFVPCAVSVLLLWLPSVGAALGGERLDDGSDAARAGSTERPERNAAQLLALVAVGLHSVGFVSVSLLLVRALDVDADVTQILLAFAGLRLVTALASRPVGRLVDTTSPSAVVIGGFVASAFGVLLVAQAPNTGTVWIGLLVVGLAEAMTKAPVKVWLVGLGPRRTSGAILGDRAALSGIGQLVGSIAVGALWGADGSAVITVFAVLVLLSAATAARVGSLVPASS